MNMVARPGMNLPLDALKANGVSTQTLRYLGGQSKTFTMGDWRKISGVLPHVKHGIPQYDRALRCLTTGYLDRMGFAPDPNALSPRLISDLTSLQASGQSFLNKQDPGSRIPQDLLGQMRIKTALHRRLLAQGRRVAATFCSARHRPLTVDENRAFTYAYLGALFFGDELTFLNGGGPGLMGVTSAGVALSNFDLNATVSLDLIFEDPHTIVPPHQTIKAEHFTVRKPGLMDITSILQVMIGGFGTLEEVSESVARNYRGEMIPGKMNLMYTSRMTEDYPTGIAGKLFEWLQHQANTGMMDPEQALWLSANLYYTGSYRDYVVNTPRILGGINARENQFSDHNVISHPANEAAYQASLAQDLKSSRIFNYIDPEKTVSLLGPSESLDESFKDDAAQVVQQMIKGGRNVIVSGSPTFLKTMVEVAEQTAGDGQLIAVQHITESRLPLPAGAQRSSLVRFRNSNIMNMAMINGAYYYLAYPGFMNDDFTYEVVCDMQTLKLSRRDLVQVSPGNLHDPLKDLISALGDHRTVNPEDCNLIDFRTSGQAALRQFSEKGLFDSDSPRSLRFLKEPDQGIQETDQAAKIKKHDMDLVMMVCLLEPVLGDEAPLVAKLLKNAGVTPATVSKERERILSNHPDARVLYHQSHQHYGPSILNFALLLGLRARALGIPMSADIADFFPKRDAEDPHYTGELLSLLQKRTGMTRDELRAEMLRILGGDSAQPSLRLVI